MNLRVGELVAFRHQALGDRLVADARGVQPPAVVGDLDYDLAALVISGELDRAVIRLAGGAALARQFQPVIGGVPHDMRQRIADHFQNLAVELGLGAEHFEFDFFFQVLREIAHDARQLRPGVADRLHSRLDDAFLQFGGDVGKPLQRRLEFAVLGMAHDFEQLVTRQHQFRNHRHQTLKRFHLHAERLRLRRFLALFVFAADFDAARRQGFAAFRGGFQLFHRCGRRRRHWLRLRHLDFRFRFAERTLQIVERYFSRTKLALQGLDDERRLGRGFRLRRRR